MALADLVVISNPHCVFVMLTLLRRVNPRIGKYLKHENTRKILHVNAIPLSQGFSTLVPLTYFCLRTSLTYRIVLCTVLCLAASQEITVIAYPSRT